MPSTDPVTLQACLNGARRVDDHAALPVRPRAVAEDARRCLDAGADGIHVHPRDEQGAESLEADDIARTLLAIRRVAPETEVSVSTGAWIEPDPVRRLGRIRRWEHRPDVASVNLSERGAIEVAETLLDLGIGVEAGVWSLADADVLIGSGLADHCHRVLVEAVGGETPETALALVDAILGRLHDGAVESALLVHGSGQATWPVLERALTDGIATRVGLEDTRRLPDGRPAASNAELISAARRLRPRSALA